jgi:hypothetical protein
VSIGTIGMPAVLDGADVFRRPHDTLRQQKSGGERAIVAGGPHDHCERLPVQADLERLLNRREVVRRTIRPAVGTADNCDRH